MGNVHRLGLTRAVRGHDTPTVGLGELDSLDGLGNGTDLVDLEEEGVAGLLLGGGADTGRVGDEEVVTDNLDGRGLAAARSAVAPHEATIRTQ